MKTTGKKMQESQSRIQLNSEQSINHIGSVLKETSLFVDKPQFIINGEYMNFCLKLFQGAKQSIFVSMGLISMTSWQSHPTLKLIDELVKAADRGVEVRIFTSDMTSRENKSGILLGKLGNSKIKLTLLSNSRICHHKAIIVDNQKTVIGSHNWTAPALTELNELSVAIDSEQFAQRTIQAITRTYAQI